MIKGTVRTEQEYRALPMNSSSSLKDFAKDRKKYYRKYVLGEDVQDDETKAATMGRLVETKLMEPEMFDDRFFPSVCESSPTGLMLNFVEALYKHTKEATNEEGIVTRSFEELSQDAYKDSEYKISYDRVLKSFLGSEAEVYYQEIREVRTKGLTVVSIQDITNCEKIVEQLQNDPFVSSVVNQTRTSRYDVYNQYQIDSIEYNGLLLKGMMDKIIIDHQEKVIQAYDLKCTWAVENFFSEYYLYRRGDIQGAVYYYLLRTHFAELISQGYVVKPLIFLVCDSTGYYSPLFYPMTEELLKDSVNGYTFKDKIYAGLNDIVEDLKWAVENDVWNISRTNYLTNGVAKLG
jgi:hypothetical protein